MLDQDYQERRNANRLLTRQELTRESDEEERLSNQSLAEELETLYGFQTNLENYTREAPFKATGLRENGQCWKMIEYEKSLLEDQEKIRIMPWPCFSEYARGI